MRATVALDDELVRKAQELSGVTERTALLREALKALIHFEASRRLAAVGGTEPDLNEIKRVRADSLSPHRMSEEEAYQEAMNAASPAERTELTWRHEVKKSARPKRQVMPPSWKGNLK
ncbi:MAG: type II toxin-antitoxin system VapB family antitoxin [Terracidiphilus sp.]|jgi:Arc/MetJ family transcription regulator